MGAANHDVAVWQEEFRLADTDNKGYLSPDAVKDLFKKHLSVPQRYMHKSSLKTKAIDKNNDGKIDVDEYCELRKKFADIKLTFPAKPAPVNREEDIVVPEESTFEKIDSITKGNLQSTDCGLAKTAALALEPMLASKAAVTLFAGLGGPAILVTLLERWKHDYVISRSCCYLIAQVILYYGENGVEDIASGILVVNGLEAIVEVFSEHNEPERGLSQHAMNAVGNIFWSIWNNEELYARTTKKFASLGGIKLMFDAMKGSRANLSVQDAGCFLLNQIFKGGIPDASMVTALALLANAVLNFPDNDKLKGTARFIVNQKLK